MEFFTYLTKIDFTSRRNLVFGFSVLFMGVSLFFLVTRGLNLSLAFSKEIRLEYALNGITNFTEIGDTLATRGIRVEPKVNEKTDSLIIKIKLPNSYTQSRLIRQISKAIPTKLKSVNISDGQTLIFHSFLASLVALSGAVLYIALRFEYRLALGVLVSLFHDAMLILGFFAFLRTEFNMLSLMILLMVLGYSLHNKIVLLDRIRENFCKYRDAPVFEIINLSLNQILPRDLVMFSLTLLGIIPLSIFSEGILRDFSLVILGSVFICAYSSIYLTGPVALWLGLNRGHLLRRELKR